jgi:serine protease Do
MSNSRCSAVISALRAGLVCVATGAALHHAVAQNQSPPSIGAERPPAVADPGVLGSVFAEIAAKTVPTVVSVIPTRIDTLLPFRNPFRYFFGDSLGPFGFFFGPEDGQQEPREYRQQSLGSGVIISREGLIVTNSHVVQGASQIEVRLSDGRSFEAEIVGSDSLADVALIRLKEKVDDLPVAYFGNSDNLRPGDWVLAVGNPFSLTSSVTLGVVSALNRQVGSDERYENYIQTDAAINPGNSGGALVNIKGELVGINTLIFTRTGGFMGIGFAVPVNAAIHNVNDLLEYGKVVRGWIGVTIQDITATMREALGLETTLGALIADVLEGEPADRAGMRSGDVVVSVNDRPVNNAGDFRNIIGFIRPGTRVPVRVIRDGKERTLTLTVAERTPEQTARAPQRPDREREPEAPSARTFGIEVSELTGELRTRLSIPRDIRGVAVTGVSRALTDQRAQLRPGDVVLEVKPEGRDAVRVNSVKQFREIAKKTKQGDAVLLRVWRQGNVFFVPFTT